MARLVRKNERTSLRELLELSSLLCSSRDSSRGRSAAEDNDTLAGLRMEFLCESEFGKEESGEFLHTLGKIQGDDLPEIEAGFMKVYSVGVDGVAEAWR